MKINSINLINNYSLKQKINKKENSFQNSTNIQFLPKMPMPFLGGLSLNLKQTQQSLKEEEYPADIQALVEKELSLNPESSKTLYDIHFEKYDGINECYSLEELKEKYPEFSKVLSANEVLAKNDSFVGKFKNNQLQLFLNDEDLSLQLIKLYWGQGFSLNDLSNYLSVEEGYEKGFNLFYTLNEKLNIPLMRSHYASLLKLSNKAYNEQLVNAMKQKRNEAREIRKQQQENEPVIIKRGPLSLEHRKHISESLKKYFENHPENIYQMSQRQKQFYIDNPKEIERMSEIMDYAWNNTVDGKYLKKKMSKFFTKHQITEEQLLLKEAMPKTTQDLLTDFWNKNPWAKNKLSSAMLRAYDFHSIILSEFYDEKNIPHKKIFYPSFPKTVEEKIINFAKENGIKESEMYAFKWNIATVDNIPPKIQSYISKMQNIAAKFHTKYPHLADYEANMTLKALITLHCAIYFNSSTLPKSLTGDTAKFLKFKREYQQLNEKYNFFTLTKNGFMTHDKIPLSDIQNYTNELMGIALMLDCCDLVEFYTAALNDTNKKRFI